MGSGGPRASVVFCSRDSASDCTAKLQFQPRSRLDSMGNLAGDAEDDVLGVDCPWDGFLEYRDKRMEAKYLQGQHHYWCTADCVTYYAVVVGGLSWGFFTGLASRETGNGLLADVLNCHWWLLLPSLMAGMLIWCCKTGRGPYKDYKTRLNFIVWLRVGVFSVNTCLLMLGGCMRISSDEPILFPLVAHTSTGPLVFACLGLRLPNRKNLCVQGLGTVVSLICLPFLASACGPDPLVIDAMQKVGIKTEIFLLSTVAVFSPASSHGSKIPVYSWWLVGMFYQVLFSFIIPAAGFFVAEAHSRAIFLTKSRKLKRSQLWRFFEDSAAGMLFVLLMVVQLLWFLSRECHWAWQNLGGAQCRDPDWTMNAKSNI